MAKKFNYKLPSMVALTLFGTAFTAHQANAAEQPQDQSNHKNVLDDQTALKQAEKAKSEVTQSTTNVSGTQTYQDPTQVQPEQDTQSTTYDASLDEMSTYNEISSNQNQQSSSINDANQNQTNSSTKNQQEETNHLTQEDKTSTDTNQLQETQSVADENEKDLGANAGTEQQDKKMTASQPSENQAIETQTSSNDNESQQKSQQVTSEQNETVTPKVSNTNASGYNFDYDDEDDDSSTDHLEPISLNNVNATSKQTTSYKYKEPAQRVTTNTAIKETASNQATVDTKQFTPFSATAQPRTVYSVSSQKTSSLPKYTPKVNSSINNYIRKKNMKAPRIEEDYTSYFPKYGYRNGVGRPEGIVVHDTANDNSTIDGEIAFMKRNYNSAFVHAFVDGNRIIETAPTDYLSWGAGPYGNQRFINVEIVHTHDYDSFARSMNNYADYAATQLQYYNLKPDSAENDGRGTVWTHAAISNFLGGTDHADPHQYLRSHNYSYAELYDLIYEKYLIKTGQVAPWGTTSTKPSQPSKPSGGTNNKLTVSANRGVAQIKPTNNGLYTTVYDSKGHKTDQVQKTLSVTKTATLGNNKFYLVEDYNSGKKYGWVKQGDVVYNTAKAPVKVNQTYNVKAGSTLYTVPWGTPKQVASKVSGTGNQTFKATKLQQIDKATYLYGTVNGKSGWISKYYLTSASKPSNPTKPSTNNQLTVTNNSGVAQINAKNSGLYTTVYDTKGKTTDQIQRTLSVTKAATLGDKKFYLVGDYNTGTNYGWVKQDEVIYNTAKSPVKINQTYNVKPGVKFHTVPWGTYNQVAGTVSGKGDQTFKATKQQQIDKATYLYGTVNGKSGWISKYYLTTPSKVQTLSTQSTPAPKQVQSSTQTVNQIAQVKANNSGIRASVYDKTAKSGTKYANRTFLINKQRTEGNNTYVLLQDGTSNTPLGWVNINDVTTQNIGKQTQSIGKYSVKPTNNGLYSIAWGTKNQQLLAPNTLANQAFNASKAVYVGKDLYLYGTVNNRTGWIAAKDLIQNSTDAQATPYNYTFVINNSKSYFYMDPTKANRYSLKPYYEQTFTVIKQKNINGVKWYYGQLLDGKYVWIKSTDLVKEKIKYAYTGMTLNNAINIQSRLKYKPQVQNEDWKWSNANYSQIKNAMDTKRLANDSSLKYQFLRLDQPQYLSAQALNKLLKGKGVLENQGAAFSQAARKYGLNEIYLISHALVETGNGTSQLAKGGDVSKGKFTTKTGHKYHNVFGIGAFDNNALVDGIKYAKNAGWTSVSKAIIGGAKFIGNSYVKAGQNTLYKMRWNPASPGTHQYATDINWANVNAQVLKQFYDKIGEVGKYFEIPTYK